MGKSERVEIRLDEDLLQRVDEWMAEGRGAESRSDALRQLVEAGLASRTGKSIQLSAGEKLNFMLLRDLVKHLKVETETNVDLVAESIYGGHNWAPVWEMGALFNNHADNPADVSFVVDVLDMWSFIEERIEKLSAKELEAVKTANHGHVPKFPGFDGNNESELMSIARFMVEEMERFTRFTKRSFNSHCPMASRYRSMLSTFEPIRATLDMGRMMGVDQLIEILQRS